MDRKSKGRLKKAQMIFGWVMLPAKAALLIWHIIEIFMS